MKEQIVVTLTSWTGRIANVPTVLDSIFAQTVQPDAIVLNLAEEEFVDRVLPKDVQDYIDKHSKIQVNWRKYNTKVFKKVLPTLLLYPDALIVCIDDDFIYPPTLIEEFLKVHKQHPDSPISGNHYVRNGIQYHCGCASMIQAKHLEGWEKYANSSKFRSESKSDDVFYTMLAAKNGYVYEHTDVDYMRTMEEFNPGIGHSKADRISINESERACYEAMGVHVIHYPNEGKPLCVLGAMQTEMGKVIEARTVRWLTPYYDVYVVRHDGSTFEYAAIKFAKGLSMLKNAPILYLHTKGAVNKRSCSIRVRRMWRHEFTVRQAEYYKSIEGEGARVACPYTGQEKVTWFNGWVANAQALREAIVEPTDNRFYWEYDLFKHADVNAMRLGNIVDTSNKMQTMHADLIKYFDR